MFYEQWGNYIHLHSQGEPKHNQNNVLPQNAVLFFNR